MTSPTDPRDALAQRLDPNWFVSPYGVREYADAILADGSRFLSPAQAAEQDRLAALGKAVERLPDARGSVLVIANYSDEEWEVTAEWWEGTVLRHGADRHRDMAQAIAAALDEPVTGEAAP